MQIVKGKTSRVPKIESPFPHAQRLQQASNLPDFLNLNKQEKQSLLMIIGIIIIILDLGDNKQEIVQGTAWAIDPRIIITSAHTLTNLKNHYRPRNIKFLPGVQSFREENLKYAYAGVLAKYRNPRAQTSFKPTNRELAMVLLDRKLENECFLKMAYSQDLLSNRNVKMIGYPSSDHNCFLSEVHGEIASIAQGNVAAILYEKPTQIGYSGAPIIQYDCNKSPRVIGIHTHKGPQAKWGLGIIFSPANLKKMAQYKEYLLKMSRKDKFFLENQLAQNVFDQYRLEMKNKNTLVQVNCQQNYQLQFMKGDLAEKNDQFARNSAEMPEQNNEDHQFFRQNAINDQNDDYFKSQESRSSASIIGQYNMKEANQSDNIKTNLSLNNSSNISISLVIN